MASETKTVPLRKLSTGDRFRWCGVVFEHMGPSGDGRIDVKYMEAIYDIEEGTAGVMTSCTKVEPLPPRPPTDAETIADLRKQLANARAETERAVAAERERCAAVADEQYRRSSGCRVCFAKDGTPCQGQADAAEAIANAIRARGEGDGDG